MRIVPPTHAYEILNEIDGTVRRQTYLPPLKPWEAVRLVDLEDVARPKSFWRRPDGVWELEL